MDTRRVTLVDAFAREPLTGNPAGVVPDGDGLSEGQMQAVARELNASETAFVLDSGTADRRIRYFTPRTEVDLCGHATIGAFAHLHRAGTIDPGTSSLETNVGTLEIELESDGTVWMTQDHPTVRTVDLGAEAVAEILSIDPVAIEEVTMELPLAVASTGLEFLIVPITYLEHLGAIEVDDEAIEECCDRVDAAGLFAFTFDALAVDATVHARCFAPGLGISEDPVTGTASGALGAYLDRFDAFGGETVGEAANEIDNPSGADGETPAELVLEQGHFVDRPGRVRIEPGPPVRVGGTGVVSLEGSIAVPTARTDDIIEV